MVRISSSHRRKGAPEILEKKGLPDLLIACVAEVHAMDCSTVSEGRSVKMIGVEAGGEHRAGNTPRRFQVVRSACCKERGRICSRTNLGRSSLLIASPPGGLRAVGPEPRVLRRPQTASNTPTRPMKGAGRFHEAGAPGGHYPLGVRHAVAEVIETALE